MCSDEVWEEIYGSKDFIPFQCKMCVYGIYNKNKDTWSDGCNAEDEQECHEFYMNKEKRDKALMVKFGF